MGKSSWSPGGLVQYSWRDIQDLGGLLEGSGMRRIKVPAKPAVGIVVRVGVEHIGHLLLQTPSLGRIQSGIDQLECRNSGRAVGVVTLTYRRLVPPVLRTVWRKCQCHQRSLARGSPQHEGTVVPVGIWDLLNPRLEWAIREGEQIPPLSWLWALVRRSEGLLGYSRLEPGKHSQ